MKKLFFNEISLVVIIVISIMLALLTILTMQERGFISYAFSLSIIILTILFYLSLSCPPSEIKNKIKKMDSIVAFITKLILFLSSGVTLFLWGIGYGQEKISILTLIEKTDYFYFVTIFLVYINTLYLFMKPLLLKKYKNHIKKTSI